MDAHRPGVGLAAMAADLLREGRAVIIVAGGGSMRPFICEGESVFLEPLRRPPRVGEVVYSRNGDTLILHRVVRRTSAFVVTRGDAAGADDAPIPPELVLGRAVAVSGRRPLHLRPLFGRLAVAAVRLRRSRFLPEPVRSLVRRVRGRGRP